jgi:HAD superfamily hydrolase (TIGR01509 family)
MQYFRDFEPAEIEVLLCDADGNLFPSEEPAFDASVGVTNRFLERFGLPGNRTALELRKSTTGKNFRTTAVDLAVAGGVRLDAVLTTGYPDAMAAANAHDGSGGDVLTGQELEQWVLEERAVVTAHLGAVLEPDPAVYEPLTILSRRYRLAAVSSSAAARLDACFAATALDALMPAPVRFSAEDSLPIPTSKPDPAIYRLAGEVLGVQGGQGLAIEDSVPGVLSAVAAGFVVAGNVMFVPPEERSRRVRELRDAGASLLIETWSELGALLENGSDVVAVGSTRESR